MADNKYLDLNGLGYAIRKMDAKKADIESPVFTGTPTTPTAAKDTKDLTIANTKWVNDNYVGKQGDATINGTLTVIGNKYPIFTLKDANTNVGGGHYLMNIQGNLMFGDCTSNNASRQYYGRMVPLLGKAVVGAVAIGYNPKDDKIYSKTTDYGIKFDVDAASATSATPSIQHQAASFFVGVNGAVVGYSGDINTKLNYDTQIYSVLDSNNIKTDAYIKSLESRIAALEAAIEKLTQHEGTYLDPIPYTIGMTVQANKWYTDGSEIQESIAAGVPTGFNDRNYFEIV